ncbi:hypothetical protein RHMOL_Rhmol05G0288800 [Rhododendron molle]|uniref:Uncharacterized protein n=1 Tax=Rhododendron molle TaxID=49168 RepID=A0ACC0NVS4_RHOML|nr:hypothetical protein RHMOL_Rhmol05G0288800 [Rhododendron molle]
MISQTKPLPEAYYLGAQAYQLPYLGPSLDFENPVTAVSFASATSGSDPATAKKTVLWIQGARKIAVNGLPPLGCIPIVITNLPPNPKDSQAVSAGERKCLDYVNGVSAEFSSLHQEKLQDLESELPETEIVYIDYEKSLLDARFNEVNKGCCGTGLIEIGRLCNQTSPLCVDTSKNEFWDAARPTEKTYAIIFKRNLPAIDAIIAS